MAARTEDKLVGYGGIARLGVNGPTSTRFTPLASIRPTRAMALAAGCWPACSNRRRWVFLEVRTDNEAAIGLYRSAGFVNVGLRKRYYRVSGADAYTMRRQPGGNPG